MLKMVRGMKDFAQGFQEQFKKDDAVIDNVNKLQNTNIDRTDTEVDKINQATKHVVTGFMQRIFMLIFAIAAFLFMFIFIRMFPSKVYY